MQADGPIDREKTVDEVRKEPLKLPDRWVKGQASLGRGCWAASSLPHTCFTVPGPWSLVRRRSFQWCNCDINSDAELAEVRSRRRA